MALQVASSLLVTNVRSIVSLASAKLGLTLSPVASLFLNALQISRGPVALSGRITPGSSTSPGSAVVSVDATAFADLKAQAAIGSRVTLHYDSVSFEILQIEIARAGTAAALAAPGNPEEVAAE